MKLPPHIIVAMSAILFFVYSCSIFSVENKNPTIQISSSETLLAEGSIQIKTSVKNQEITLTEDKPASQQISVSSDTFSFSFSFLKNGKSQLLSQGNTGLTLEVDKNYRISFSAWKVDTTSNSMSYGGCFECLKFNSFSINHSVLDSTSSLFNHRLLVTFVD